MIDVTPAQRWEAEYIGAHLRAEDYAEVITASGGQLPHEVVPQSFDHSVHCYTIRPALADALPVSIFGVCDDPGTAGLGVVWLLATDGVLQVSRRVIQCSTHYLNLMSRDYPLGLYNYLDARNHLHLKWCLRSGFSVLNDVEIHEHPFHLIYRPRPAEYFGV